jgi:ankyrin repeat protein
MSDFQNFKIQRAASLQLLLGDLTLDSLDDNASQIIHSDMINTESGIRQIASAILVTVNTRPLIIPLLSQLVGALSSAASPENLLGGLESCILETISRSLSSSKPFPNEAGALAFLFQAFTNGVIIHDIAHFVKRLSREPSVTLSICWILCYFAPELEAADPSLFMKAIDQIRISSIDHGFPRIFQIFLDQLDLLEKDNWRILKVLRNFFADSSTPSLESCIRDDDVESLQQHSLAPLFSLDTRISSTPFLPSPYLVAEPTLIQVAAFFGARKCFKWLQTKGANLCARDRNFVTLPQMAVAGGDVEIIRLCQTYGLDFSSAPHSAVIFHRNDIFDWLSATTATANNEVDVNGQTTFHCACESNNLHALAKLLPGCKDVNAVSIYRQWTPLCIAVRGANLEAIQCLLSVPSLNINAIGSNGLTPLHVAAHRGDIEIAELLIERGAQTGIVANGRTPLLIALKQRQSLVAAYLLTVPGVDLNAATPTGVTPLMAAIRSGLDGIAAKLANDPRVNVNSIDSEGRTALYWAIKHHKSHVFDAIIAREDVNLKVITHNHFTLLHIAAKHPRMMHALLTRGGIDVNAINSDGMTALHRAIKAENSKVISMLMEQPDINVNICTARKGAPLQYALTRTTEDIAVKLIAFPNTDINSSSTGWPAPINCAIRKNLVNATRAFCARMDLKVTEDMGECPLVLAADRGNVELMNILLTHPSFETASGTCAVKAAYTLAANHGFTDCAHALKQYRKTHKAHRSSATRQQPKKRGFFSRCWQPARNQTLLCEMLCA